MKELSDLLLHFASLVLLRPEASSCHSQFGREVKKHAYIRSWKPDFWLSSPLEIQIWSVFCCRIHDARIVVTVHDYGDSSVDICLDLFGCLPPVRGKQEVDYMVVLNGLAFQIGIDRLPN